MASAKPPPEVPQLSEGALLETTGRVMLFAQAVKRPNKKHDRFIGTLPKGSLVTTVGEMAGGMGNCWVKVMTPLGLGWLRLHHLKRRAS